MSTIQVIQHSDERDAILADRRMAHTVLATDLDEILTFYQTEFDLTPIECIGALEVVKATFMSIKTT